MRGQSPRVDDVAVARQLRLPLGRIGAAEVVDLARDRARARRRHLRAATDEAEGERQLRRRLVPRQREHQLVGGREERVVVADCVVAHARVRLTLVADECERHGRERALGPDGLLGRRLLRAVGDAVALQSNRRLTGDGRGDHQCRDRRTGDRERHTLCASHPAPPHRLSFPGRSPWLRRVIPLLRLSANATHAGSVCANPKKPHVSYKGRAVRHVTATDTAMPPMCCGCAGPTVVDEQEREPVQRLKRQAHGAISPT